MLFERREHTTKEISTSSLPDIIFLLLVFFMVVTVMKTFDAPQIDMPYATKVEKLENRRNTTFLWATKDGFTVLDDIQFPDLNSGENAALFQKKMAYKKQQNPQTVVSLKADSQTKMELISNIHSLLKDDKVQAYKVSYSALRKSSE